MQGAAAPCLKDALPLCPFGTFPHTVGNQPRRAEPARPQLPVARSLQPIQKITLRFLYKMTACQNKFLLTVFAAYVIMQVQPTDILERMKIHEK